MITLTSKCYYADGGVNADTEAKICFRDGI